MAAKKAKKQAVNRRQDGKFAPGNREGKKFKPGESGNPAGRPKRTLLSEALTARLAETVPNANDKTVAELVGDALIREAIKGNVAAIREIADRTEGKPRQAVEVSGPEGASLTIQVEYVGSNQAENSTPGTA